MTDEEAEDLLMGVADLIQWRDEGGVLRGYVDNDNTYYWQILQVGGKAALSNNTNHPKVTTTKDGGKVGWGHRYSTVTDAKKQANAMIKRRMENNLW